MSVRKRTWTTVKGEPREAWLVDTYDREGNRCFETFERKRDADARHAAIKVDVKAGVHVAPSRSVTVATASRSWLKAAEANGLERSTIKQYREHVDLHIVPFIGTLKLSDVSAQVVRKFEDALREQGRSPAMVKRVRASLGSLISDAQEQGLVARNAVRDLGRNRKRGSEGEKRQKGKLKIGVDIPTPGEIKIIIANAKDRWRPLLLTAVFTGLRASELRGLRWADVNLKKNELHVRQRADRFNEIGKPKSLAGERVVPFGKMVANTLKEWKLRCPKSRLDLVFPNGAGNIEALSNIITRGLISAQGDRVKYTGLHSLRHFYASWCINSVDDAGLGLPPKTVQERLGHSSITMTYDRYGHLFPRGDDSGKLDTAESALLA